MSNTPYIIIDSFESSPKGSAIPVQNPGRLIKPDHPKIQVEKKRKITDSPLESSNEITVNSNHSKEKKRKCEKVYEYSDKSDDDFETFFTKESLKTQPIFHSSIEQHCAESLNYKLLQWIVLNQHPFSVLETNSFLRLIFTFDLCYEISD
ncbi:26378_t:CDS:1, partial [Racocetra persica]